MKPHLAHHPRERGVALVTTVIVVAVLAVVAVAFMQSTTTDRLSSRSVANYTRAKLAAEGGAAAAEAMITDLVKRYPDSATVWQNIGGGAPNGTNNEATVLYLRARASDTNLGASPAQFGGEVTILAQPLVSRVGATPETFNTNPLPLSSVASSVPFPADTAVNINATNAVRPEPFVGSRSSTNPGAPITAAQWIYMTRNGGPVNATNPYIARYAFWIEDESFKVNLNVMTNGPRGATSLGLTAAEARLDGSWGSSSNDGLRSVAGNVISARASLGGQFPTALTAALPANLANPAAAAELRFLTTTHSAGLDLSRGGFKRFNMNAATNGDKRAGLDRLIIAITNTNSASLFGQRFYRVRNDAAGINSTNAVSTNHAAIYLQKIAANIYDYLDVDDQPTVISNSSTFNLVTGRPTVGILPLGGGTSGTNPIAAMGVENVPRLQEYAIHLRVRSIRWDASNPDSFGFVFNTNEGAVNPTTANYEVWLDHYFEFWNPGTRNFTNSPDTFLKIFDQPAWGPGSGGGGVTGTTGRGSGSFVSNNRTSSEIPLIDALTSTPVVFPAGEVTVLTTAPLTALNTGADSAGVLVVTTNPSTLVPLANVPAADRVFTGTTTSILATNYLHVPAAAAFSGGPDYGYTRLFDVAMKFGRPGGTGNTDYASGVLIGNDQGIIESHVGLPIGVLSGNSGFSAAVLSSWNRNDLSHIGNNILNGQIDNVRGGGLRGNANNGASTATTKPNATEGDPRSLLEQLEFNIYVSGGGSDQTRFYNTIGPGASPMFGNNTFGRPNTNYVRAAGWTDSSSINPGPSNAPLFVRNGSMLTIGELGHITDPARPYSTSGSVPTLARGGGRTLRVGQSELTNFGGTNIGWYSGNQTNASRTWTSWRLADIFTTTAASNGATALDAQGNLTNSLGVVRGQTNTNGVVVTIPGLINPNGVLRDGGAAVKAALYGLTFLPPGPEGASLIGGRPANLNNVMTNLIGRLTNATAGGMPTDSLNPFWERGELSELSGLNSASASTLVSGQVMSNVIDRGREELIRRSIEMITTRGSVFTVYAIGEVLQVTPQTTNVLSTARLKQTFQIEPQFQFPTDYGNDNFNPAQALRVTRRFSAPTNYTVRVLSSSYD